MLWESLLLGPPWAWEAVLAKGWLWALPHPSVMVGAQQHCPTCTSWGLLPNTPSATTGTDPAGCIFYGDPAHRRVFPCPSAVPTQCKNKRAVLGHLRSSSQTVPKRRSCQEERKLQATTKQCSRPQELLSAKWGKRLVIKLLLFCCFYFCYQN